MQAMLCHVDVFKFWGVELYDAVLGVPEQILDHAHLLPRRASMRQAGRGMVPPVTLGTG